MLTNTRIDQVVSSVNEDMYICTFNFAGVDHFTELLATVRNSIVDLSLSITDEMDNVC